MVTIKEVAKEAKVSITTVSMVLSEKEYPISGETKKRVFAAADKLGYSPNRVAQSLVTKKSRLIALVVPDITNPYFPEVAKAVEIAAEKIDYQILLMSTSSDQEVIRKLTNSFVDGALVVTRSQRPLHVGKSFPVVYLDENKDTTEEDHFLVTSDNYQGGYLAAKHLISLGHSRLACITGPVTTPNSIARYEGFLQGCLENSIEKPVEVQGGNYTFKGGYESGQSVIASGATAVFCFNDVSAFGFMKYADEVGIQVPKDISVIGYDDILMTRYSKPSLTTIHQNVSEIGKEAVHMLSYRLEGKPVIHKKKYIQPSLIVRNTTARI